MHVEGLPELAIVLGLGLGDHAGGGHGCGTGRGGAEGRPLRSLLSLWPGLSEFRSLRPATLRRGIKRRSGTR